MGLVDELAAAAVTRAGAPRASGSMREKLRAVAESHGPTAPFGAGNSKTGTWGTYLPVGITCPRGRCVHHPENDGTCYALYGRVGIVERRARAYLPDPGPFLRSAACALVAARAQGKRARLHVSGDVGTPGRGDAPWAEYLVGLIDLAIEVRAAVPGPPDLAWTYTALDPIAMSRWTKELAQYGVHVRYSGEHRPDGAITFPFERLGELREQNPNIAYVKCPGQLAKSVVCASCPVCIRAKGTVVFDPHGALARAAEEAATKIL